MGQPIAIYDRILENSYKSHIPIFISKFTIATYMHMHVLQE